jgi:hypothetical protein
MSDGPEFLHVNCITYRVAKLSARCSNRLSIKAAGELKPEAYLLGYVEDFDEPRTRLGACFSILAWRL